MTSSASALPAAGSASLDRVLQALGHPVRRQILRSLVAGDGSASAISKQFGLDLGTVSYHLNQVLAKECGVVELVRTVPRRGSIEKIYRLDFDGLQRGLIMYVAGLEADVLELLEDSGWNWSVARVDAEGWEEICRAREEFDRRARAALERSRDSDGSAPLREVVVGIAAFSASTSS